MSWSKNAALISVKVIEYMQHVAEDFSKLSMKNF